MRSTSLAIRPLKTNAKPASVSIATETIKVAVVLQIGKSEEALTQATFKRAELEAELKRRIDDEVKKRTAELAAKVEKMQQAMDAELPQLSEGIIAERVLQRREHRILKAIERNDDNVIGHVTDALYLGEDAYVVFELQTRDKSPYRLATVQVVLDGKDRAGLVRFASTAAETAGEGVGGVVPPRGRGTGVVVLRGSAELLGKSLTLQVAQPGGRGKITVDRVVLKYPSPDGREQARADCERREESRRFDATPQPAGRMVGDDHRNATHHCQGASRRRRAHRVPRDRAPPLCGADGRHPGDPGRPRAHHRRRRWRWWSNGVTAAAGDAA